MNKDQSRALAAAKAALKKRWGNETFVTSFNCNLPAISTGSLKLDHLLSIGGLPEGRIVEISGLESSGKSSICTIICGEAQRKYPDKLVAYIDLEHALDPSYAKQLGFDVVDMETGAIDEDKVLFCQPAGGVEALDIAISLAESGACSVVVIDSVGGLVTDNEMNGDVGDNRVGEKARLLSQELPKLMKAADSTGTLVVFVNQIRNKIVPYGDPTTTMGGNALRFWCSVRLEVKTVDILKKGDTAIGQTIRVKVKKSKVSPPFGVVDINLYFGKGFDQDSELVDVALARNAIVQSGAWYYVNKNTPHELKFQGRNAVADYAAQHPDFREYLKGILFDSKIEKEEPTQEEIEDQNGTSEETAA